MLSIMCFKHKSFLKKLPCIEAGNALRGAPEVCTTCNCRKASDKCTMGFKADRVREKFTKACTTTKITNFQGLLVLLSLYAPQSALPIPPILPMIMCHDTYIVASMRVYIEVKAIKLVKS